jgi:hypothetical protein
VEWPICFCQPLGRSTAICLSRTAILLLEETAFDPNPVRPRLFTVNADRTVNVSVTQLAARSQAPF